MHFVAIKLCMLVTFFTLTIKVNADYGCPFDATDAIIEYHREKNLRTDYNIMFEIATGVLDTYVCDHLRTKFGEEALSKCTGLCKRIQYIRTDGIDTIDNDTPLTSDCDLPPITCQPTYPYRTADGSCNNLKHTRWGMTGETQMRLLPNSYSDGKGTPRTSACPAPGSELPSARLVSNKVHHALSTSTFDSKRSMMLMQWGQFLTHDCVLTPTIRNRCTEDHPDCFNIPVPANDSRFSGSLRFSRSDYMTDCNGIRQQVNFQTDPIDCSQVYGPTQHVQDLLRGEAINGKMDMNNQKLPVNPAGSTCRLEGDFNATNNYCTFSGDVRGDQQAGLTSIHTIWVREHNRIAEDLYAKNPHWDSEKIFQESRKIVVALNQHITYDEWLPAVVGLDILKEHNIDVKRGFRLHTNIYNPHVRASVSNEFNVAAFRFGHSMISNFIGQVANTGPSPADEPLQDTFLRTTLYHSFEGKGLDMVLRWFTDNKLLKVDSMVEHSVRNALFERSPGVGGSDLAARNIQRGRDHGIQGYNKYRAFCGLPVALHMNYSEGGLVDMEPENVQNIQAVYNCPNDVDLFTGLLAERPLPGMIVGPLLQCLIVKQFKSLRIGDRFFYEEHNCLTGFTKRQLRAIKKVSFASVMCANTDSQTMPENVFYTDGGRKNCSDYAKLDLSAWRSRRYRG